MYKFANKVFAGALGVICSVLVSPVVHADVLSDIKARGEMIVGVKDSTEPFGFIKDPSNRVIVGYDIDIADAIARGLGVKLKAIPVTSATRIPELMQGRIDLIAATMTHSKAREEQIDFSFTYFVTGQKVLVKSASGIKKVEDLAGKKVSSTKGSTSEQNIKGAVPTVDVISFSDYPLAFLALQQGKVEGMTTDETILLPFKLKAEKPSDYRLLDKYISTEPYGLGIKKGEGNFRFEVNKILVNLEKTGEAKKIFDKWFGPKSSMPLNRTFKFETDKI